MTTTGDTSAGRAALIMVVEDEPGARMLISTMLSRSGFEVLEAPDAAAALKILEQRKPDLIMTDIMMPNMNGIELCRRLRARPDTARTPLLVITARSDPESAEQAQLAGADGYMVKPLFWQELVATVRGLLELED